MQNDRHVGGADPEWSVQTIESLQDQRFVAAVTVVFREFGIRLSFLAAATPQGKESLKTRCKSSSEMLVASCR